MNHTRNSLGALFIIALLAAPTPQAQTPVSPTLTISGDLPRPLTLITGDLAHMTRETVTLTGHAGASAYEGVPLTEILHKAGVPAGSSLRGKALLERGGLP